MTKLFKMNKKYRHVALVAVSGTGKGTVAQSLMHLIPTLRTSVSATTRPPRQGEVESIHYYFQTKPLFEEGIKKGLFAEWFSYNNHLYGTLFSEIKKRENAGQVIVFDVEINGAMMLKKSLGDSLLTIFLECDLGEIEKRLRGRGTESEEYIQNRLLIGREKEIPRKNECDLIIWYGPGADPDLTANQIANLMLY